jgi:elongator complex protein 3
MSEAIKELLKYKINNRNELMLAKRKIAKRFSIPILDNKEVSVYYKEQVGLGLIKNNPEFLSLLKKRSIRTMSGIAPVAVLTKPYSCPGNCAFCPSEKDVPQSYLSNEPAVMRAIRCGYNPYVQVQDRLRALVENGHEPTKVELIVIGGTWSYLPVRYKYWYILNLFKGANDFKETRDKKQDANKLQISINKTLAQLKALLLKEQKRNEKTKYNIIGLTLETRPDYIDEKELWQMRELGCTRVELGVQAIDDKILLKNNRGHNVNCVARATKLLKDFGFKVTYHLMPNLPGATVGKDKKIYKQLFNDERFQPDQVKFYPTIVTKGSLLYEWWQAGEYKPYSAKVLKDLIVYCKTNTPEYVRIIRLIRDIPGESIEAGNKITNLRQVMQQEGVQCRCIRCREPQGQLIINNEELRIVHYPASGGVEYFISVNSKDDKILFGFCRLRIDGTDVATIRELHVYGELVPVGSEKKVQHAGLGKNLMEAAEDIAKKENCVKMRVISGVGVRGYYRKLGFRLHDTYMFKSIK